MCVGRGRDFFIGFFSLVSTFSSFVLPSVWCLGFDARALCVVDLVDSVVRFSANAGLGLACVMGSGDKSDA